MIVFTSTDSNFERDTSSGITLVDFYAPWCRPCQIMWPILEELAKEIWTKARIMKHNVDNEPLIPQKLWIRSIPTLIIYQNGTPVQKLMGIHSSQELTKIIESLLS
jgi:thioredoxin 1